MPVKLLTEHHLEFLSLNGGCKVLSESILVKMSHNLKSRIAAHFYLVAKDRNLSMCPERDSNQTGHVSMFFLIGAKSYC